MDEQDKVIVETLKLLDLTNSLDRHAVLDLLAKKDESSHYPRFAAAIKALVADE